MTTYPKSLTVSGHRLACTVETRQSSRPGVSGSLLVFLTARCTRVWQEDWAWKKDAVIRATRDRVDMLGLDAFEIYAPAAETGMQTGRIFRGGRQWDLVCEGEKT